MLHSRGKDLLFADGGLVVLRWSEISHSPHLSSPLSPRCWPAASPSLGLLTASGPEAGPMASAAGMVKAVLNSVCGGGRGVKDAEGEVERRACVQGQSLGVNRTLGCVRAQLPAHTLP